MRLELEIHSCRDPDNGATLPRCLCSGVSDPVGKLPLLQAGPGYTVIHSNMQSVNSVPSTPQLPRCHHPGPAPTNGKCHHPLDQWARVTRLSANGKCRSVAMSPSCGPMGGRGSIPGAAHTTSQQPAPATSRYGETRRQAGKLVPPAPS